MADRSSSSRSADGGTAPTGEAPGLGEQFGRTRSALLGLIRSHIDLAKAEFAEIGGEIKRAAALGGVALFLLFITGMLLTVGTLLFIGEWLFGSIGWGVLLGTEFLIAVAVLLVLAIVEFGWGRAFTSLLVAVGVGLVVGGVLAVDWPWVGRQITGIPTWLLAMAAGALAIGLLGAVLGSSFGKSIASAGFFAGAVFGALIGLLGSAGPGPRVAWALGVAAALLFWPIVAAVFVFRGGIDTEKLKARFVPMQTIDTTKETIEWVREQLPLGRK